MGAVTDEVQDVAERTLTAADRCDRCGAQAYVLTEHLAPDLRTNLSKLIELRWCAHHYRQHEAGLSRQKVLDRLTMLNR